MAKYDNVTVRLVGESGDALLIMNRVAKELLDAGVSKTEVARYRAEATAGDYDNFIRVTCAWVYVPYFDDIIDDWEEPYSDDWDDYDEDYYNDDDLKYEGRGEDDHEWYDAWTR